MKLGLGTAQFGLDYGISNRDGMTPQAEVARILAAASAGGVEYLDTAPAYGLSEASLGTALGKSQAFRIVTKTPAFAADEIRHADAEALRSTFLQSLQHLGRERIYGLLVHHAQDLTKPGGELLLHAMQELVREGVVQKLGVSVYFGKQIDDVLSLFRPDIVQLPLNVFDQRLVASGHLKKLKNSGVEIHTRSVFLQGLLLMEPASVPDYFSPLRQTLTEYAEMLATRNLTRLGGALAFIRQTEGVDCAIVGVTRERDLSEILEQFRTLGDDRYDFSPFAVADENMILPSRWKH